MKNYRALMRGPAKRLGLVRDLEEGCVDIVFCVENTKDIDRDVNRALKPGGEVVVIQDPALTDEHKEYMYMLMIVDRYGASDKTSLVILNDQAALIGPYFAHIKLRQIRNRKSSDRSYFFDYQEES